jgi:FkbM family methyltransferase
MLTAAVRDLHAACPAQFQTDVRTSAPALWENNPYLTPLREGDPGVEILDMHYPLIHQSNQRPYHFLHGYAQYLEQQLGVRIPVTRFHGDIHLSDAERQAAPPFAELGMPDCFWIVVAGGKYDFTAKWWNPECFQQVVDHFRGRIGFVQCGEQGHWHPRLRGVVDLVGKTSLRDLVRLVYHAAGVLCPVTLVMHLAAAVETRPGRPPRRACVVVAGGREPPHWEAYPQHQFVSTAGALPCCAAGGCWRSRCQPAGDGNDNDRRDLCERPVQVSPELRIPLCMHLITPDEVIRRIELYYRGGALQYTGVRPVVGLIPNASPPETTRVNEPAHERRMNVLMKFRHGLGDAVQLTSVLEHLRHYHSDWDIDVAALVGKHSAYHGLCRRVYVLDREPVDEARYDRVFELEWPECHTCYANSPSSKAERALHEVFGLDPIPERCRYVVRPNERSVALAHRYLERVCKTGAGADGRYPVVLIHYEGNTSRAIKDLPLAAVRALCDDILDGGAVPVILDWDGRTPLADGVRVHNPNVHAELWGGTGTGDAAALAALIELSALMVGVDSGPLHVAGATSTPTIGVWLRHHPLHYFGLADHVTHLVPENHAALLRGDQAVGQAFFQAHYRHRTYRDLAEELRALTRERLRAGDGGLVFTRNFWVRSRNAQQDLVVVQDVAEEDCYRVDELPMPRPVVVDVGAHIGCFSKRLHERNPLARIVAVECCPENLPALGHNVGRFASVVQAAVTYEADMALLNAVYPDCVSTGGSMLVGRAELEQRLAAGEIRDHGGENGVGGYWADLRPVATVTLEQLMADYGLERIDILKLDCEGSEFSILRHTRSLDRIGLIIGEYHGREAFLQLVQERFAGWSFRILRDGDPGTFWLMNPAACQHAG